MHRHDSERRFQTFVDWPVCPALWPIVMVAWLFTVPLVLSYVAVRFVIEALFVIRL